MPHLSVSLLEMCFLPGFQIAVLATVARAITALVCRDFVEHLAPRILSVGCPFGAEQLADSLEHDCQEACIFGWSDAKASVMRDTLGLKEVEAIATWTFHIQQGFKNMRQHVGAGHAVLVKQE